MKKIHVIFKTHLDIGFTDLAKNVIDQYFRLFIPQALDLAEQLKQKGSSAQFVWTTGAWLIDEYLKQANEVEKKRMEEAIGNGSIVWHGLPFTTHTELLDSDLLDYGLSISQKLNAKYGKGRIAAKMTDVPGHTIGMVHHLAKAGIRYLHLGVNPASTVPKVPMIFRWRSKDGSEILVNYASDYGNAVEVEGLDEAMVFAHTGDNSGPPTIAAVEAEFSRLAERYPGADIQASTMDAFAEKLLSMQENFPVVTEEIGDTWIQGAATDPLKIAWFRELLRLRDRWLSEGRLDIESKEYADFCGQLLLIPEHTWGMDEKRYLTDFINYSLADFQAARKTDVILKDAIHEKYNYFRLFAMDGAAGASPDLLEAAGVVKSFSYYESSWEEQREYVREAVRCLSPDKQAEAGKAFQTLIPEQEALEGEELRLHQTYRLGLFEVEFDGDGAIRKLVDGKGKSWADERHRIGCFQYETFGQEQYEHWFRSYMVNWKETYYWAEADWGKPGMEFTEPRPKNGRFSPYLMSLCHRSSDRYDHVQAVLAMPGDCVKDGGAPETVRIDYRFYKDRNKIDVDLSWLNKQANRLPEASWFSFNLNVDNPNLWKMDKLGQWVSPLEVVKGGNRNMHAVGSGICYMGSDGGVLLETLDAPVVSPGEKRLLQFDHSFAPLDSGMHFNLHNNVWGTNFPMWFEENAKFRFTIDLAFQY